jgi:hypothetical protein
MDENHEKYVIFLPNHFDDLSGKCIPLNNYRKSLTNDLLEKGVQVLYRKDIADIVKNSHKTFDCEKMPVLCILYTHFFNGEYFSEKLFDAEKTKRERDVLFLLAAKLGAKKITYNTKIIETTITKVNAELNIKNVDISTSYKKTLTCSEGKNGVENYENRGAPVYLLSRSFDQVNYNIKKKFDNDCKGFYEYYSSNNNLMSFVRKRFSYKMTQTEHTTKTEDNSDINVEVNAKLVDYGLGINFDHHEAKSSVVNYVIEFYTDSELRVGMNLILAQNTDPFASILEMYLHEKQLEEKNKEKEIMSIYRITEYVTRYSTEQKYYIIENDKKIYISYQELLDKWISDNGNEKFNSLCCKFTSSYQIRTWYRTVLLKLLPENTKAIDEIDETDRMDSYGLLAFGKKVYEKYKKKVMETDNYSESPDSDMNYLSLSPLESSNEMSLEYSEDSFRSEESEDTSFEEQPDQEQMDKIKKNIRKIKKIDRHHKSNKKIALYRDKNKRSSKNSDKKNIRVEI